MFFQVSFVKEQRSKGAENVLIVIFVMDQEFKLKQKEVRMGVGVKDSEKMVTT